MWAIVIKILHHPIPVSHILCELHLREMQWWAILWTTPSKYRGWHCWKVFGPGLSHSNHLQKNLTKKISMKRLTQEQWWEYKNTIKCSICTKPFKSADKKVGDHDHLTGGYRGPAHNTCNLNYLIDPKKVKIPCIINNLKKYICYIYFHNC